MTEDKVKEVLLKRIADVAERASVMELSTLTMSFDILQKIGKPNETAEMCKTMVDILKQTAEDISAKEKHNDA